MIKVPSGATKTRKRLGRGLSSGTGCTAGRGTKGQKARSGGGVRIGFEGGQMPLYRRLPRRGFSNALFRTNTEIVALKALDAHYKAGEVVSLQTLQEKQLVRRKATHVKVLSNGDISKPLSIDATVSLSRSAHERIQKAGGTVSELAPKAEESAAGTMSAAASRDSRQGSPQGSQEVPDAGDAAPAMKSEHSEEDKS